MRPRISLQPIEVLTASHDREGRLVLADGMLVAVLFVWAMRHMTRSCAAPGFSKPASVRLTAGTNYSPVWKRRPPQSKAGLTEI